MVPPQLQIALKEWAAVCSALADGRQIVLLRKGGIFETAGEFELEDRQFLLFPTYLHQAAAMLKPAEHGRLEPMSQEPVQIRLSAVGHVSDILRLSSRKQMEAIDQEHIWTPPLIDMRFSYRPQNPLYLLLVRVYRLDSPVTVQNTPAYAGCKSWVPLDRAIDTSRVSPVLSDDDYAVRRAQVRQRVEAAG